MKNSVVVFFFTSSNHLSNVKTLQSIYCQDFEKIHVIVCNDCTFGFQSERLLGNFQHEKPENIKQIYFQENSRAIGEFKSQRMFWDRIDDEFIITLHSGECFTSSDVLRLSVEKMKATPAAALIAPCELQGTESEASACRETRNLSNEGLAEIRDCMVLYRVSALKALRLYVDEKETHISRQILSQLAAEGKNVEFSNTAFCTYSDQDLHPMIDPTPAEYGNQVLASIERLLQESEKKQADLFQSAVEQPKKKKRNYFLLLNNLATFKKILVYAALALMLFVAAGLFLNLHAAFFTAMGIGFLLLAMLATVWTAGMLICNLYLKKNPQRLVM